MNVKLFLLFSIYFVFAFSISAQEEWTRIEFENNEIKSFIIDTINDSILYVCFDPYIMYSRYILAKSYDRGISWEEIGLGLNREVCIQKISINPQNNQIMYFGSLHSIYKSTDGGLTLFEINQDIGDKSISEIIIDPQFPDTLYCLADQDVYKSVNSGINWICVSTGILGSKLKMHPINYNILYLGTQYSNTLLYQSTDYGVTWQSIGNDLEGDYISGIAIGNYNEIYISITYFFEEFEAKVFKSINNGNSFEIVGDNFYNFIKGITFDSSNSDIYAYGTVSWRFDEQNNVWEEYYKDSRINSISFSNENFNWLATKHGLLKKNTITNEIELINFLLTNDCYVVNILVDNSNPGVIYVFPSSSSLFKSYDYGLHWIPKSNGLPYSGSTSRFIELSPFNSNKIFISGSSSYTYPFYKSDDTGESWQSIDIGEDNPKCIAFHPTDSLIAFLGTGDHIFKTIDGGMNWFQTNISDRLINSIAINPIYPNIIFATNFCWPGGIYKSIDEGLNWSAFNLSFDWVAQINYDNSNYDILYLVTFEALYISYNEGYTWEVLENQLPGSRYSLYQSPTIPNHLFLWISSGLYYSENAGLNWSDIYHDQGLPQNCSIYDIDFDLNRNKVLCTTRYNGIFVRDYDSFMTSVYEDVIVSKFRLNQNYPNPFNPETIIKFSISEDCKTTLTVYNIKGQLVRTLIDDKLEKGSYSIIWNSKDNNNKPVSSGVYFYKLSVNDESESVKKCLLLK